MNKRKVLGVFIIIFGLVMVGGAAQSGYGLAAPLSMLLIVLAGLAMIFWEKVNSWMQ